MRSRQGAPCRKTSNRFPANVDTLGFSHLELPSSRAIFSRVNPSLLLANQGASLSAESVVDSESHQSECDCVAPGSLRTPGRLDTPRRIFERLQEVVLKRRFRQCLFLTFLKCLGELFAPIPSLSLPLPGVGQPARQESKGFPILLGVSHWKTSAIQVHGS
jgi:hypothetical protein